MNISFECLDLTKLSTQVIRVEPPSSPPQPEHLPAPLQPVLLHADGPSEGDSLNDNVSNNDDNNGHSTSSCSANSTSSTDGELVTADENTIAATSDSADNSADEVSFVGFHGQRNVCLQLMKSLFYGLTYLYPIETVLGIK